MNEPEKPMEQAEDVSVRDERITTGDGEIVRHKPMVENGR